MKMSKRLLYGMISYTVSILAIMGLFMLAAMASIQNWHVWWWCMIGSVCLALYGLFQIEYVDMYLKSKEKNKSERSEDEKTKLVVPDIPEKIDPPPVVHNCDRCTRPIRPEDKVRNWFWRYRR